MSALSFSVVICAYSDDRWFDLEHAVASVRAQTRPALETVVVVDHNPALLARVRSELAGVRSVPNGGERGLSGARNSGIDAARGDVVAFLDDDAAAADEWLERLAACYADDDVLGVGGAIEPQWPRRRFVYEPRARVAHRVDATRTGWRYFIRRCYAEGQSKAQVARLRGAHDALATERAYTLRVLPLGAVDALREAVRRRRPARALAAAAIVAGLSATTAGYAAGQVRHVLGRRAASLTSPVPGGEA